MRKYNVISIFGAPGTGKTTNLTKLIDDLSKTTFDMVVLSYSKSSAREIQSRLKDKKLIKTKTSHSLAYEINEYQSSQVLNMDRVEEMRLCDEYFSKLDKRDFYNMFGEINLNTEKLQETFQPYLQEFNKRYKEYKQYHMLVSFSDMLLATPKVKYKYVIVDEAQDMTPLNWSFIQKLVKEGGTIYLAGDDDQNIYTFNGSDEQIMVNVATEKVILDQSYRVPSKIHEIATKHVRSISKRQDKIVKPTNFEGEVSYTNYFNLDSVTSPVTLLFRDNFLMKEVEKELLRLYLPFKKSKSKSYFDSYFAEAIRAWYSKDEAYLEKNNKFFIDTTADVKDVLKAKHWRDVLVAPFIKVEFLDYIYNVDLLGDCNIELSTIHNYKGLESDHIVLFTELPNRSDIEFYTASARDIDSEKRVWYVGLTRARKKLTIVGTNRFLEIY